MVCAARIRLCLPCATLPTTRTPGECCGVASKLINVCAGTATLPHIRSETHIKPCSSPASSISAPPRSLRTPYLVFQLPYLAAPNAPLSGRVEPFCRILALAPALGPCPDMKLDQRGDIAIAGIALYVPILLLTVVLVLRHGAAGNAGWIFFASLSIGEPHILTLLFSMVSHSRIDSPDRWWDHARPLGTKSQRDNAAKHLQRYGVGRFVVTADCHSRVLEHCVRLISIGAHARASKANALSPAASAPSRTTQS